MLLDTSSYYRRVDACRLLHKYAIASIRHFYSHKTADYQGQAIDGSLRGYPYGYQLADGRIISHSVHEHMPQGNSGRDNRSFRGRGIYDIDQGDDIDRRLHASQADGRRVVRRSRQLLPTRDQAGRPGRSPRF